MGKGSIPLARFFRAISYAIVTIHLSQFDLQGVWLRLIRRGLRKGLCPGFQRIQWVELLGLSLVCMS